MNNICKKDSVWAFKQKKEPEAKNFDPIVQKREFE